MVNMTNFEGAIAMARGGQSQLAIERGVLVRRPWALSFAHLLFTRTLRYCPGERFVTGRGNPFGFTLANKHPVHCILALLFQSFVMVADEFFE